MRRALVTGASGFLGRRLCAALSASGWSVAGLARGAAPAGLPVASWISRDLAAADPSAAELSGVDAVFHLAGPTGGAKGDDAFFAKASAGVAGSVFAACAGKVPLLVHASSQVVYGDPRRLGVVEEDALSGDTPYARAKIAAEDALKRSGLSAVALRLTGFVGGGGAADHVIDCALAGRPIELFDGGRVRRDYLAVADGISAFLAAAAAPVRPGLRVYNAGSGTAPSARELAELVLAETGSRSELRLLETPAPRGDLSLDPSKARRELGWNPRPVLQAVRERLKEAARA